MREQAATLLLRLPGSGLQARVIAAADTCLDLQVPVGRRHGLMRMLGEGRGQGTLDVKVPTVNGVDWAELGIGDPPKNVETKGRGSWLLSRLLSRVPPSHWPERFAATPEILLAAAQASAWGRDLFEAWSEAAILHEDQSWIGLLLRRWIDLARGTGDARAARALAARLLRALSPALQDEETGRLLVAGDPASVELALEARAGESEEWGPGCSRAFIQLLKTLPGRIPESARYGGEPWMIAVLQTIPRAEPLLSPENLDGVPRQWDLPGHLRGSPWSRDLAVLSEIAVLRRHIRRTLAGGTDA